jgi:hypothetical protein
MPHNEQSTDTAFLVLGSMACFIGLVMLAYFYNECDPLLKQPCPGEERVTSDQLTILFAVRTMSGLSGGRKGNASARTGLIPGLPGLFLACLFSATLSTFSSGMNSQAAVVWEDFIKQTAFARRLNDHQIGTFNKVIVGLFGVVATGLAFLAPVLGGIIQVQGGHGGAYTGPIAGILHTHGRSGWSIDRPVLSRCV